LLETALDGRIVLTPRKTQYGFDAYHVRVPLAFDRVLEGILPSALASQAGPKATWRPEIPLLGHASRVA